MERLDCVVKSDMKELLFDEETIKNRVSGYIKYNIFIKKQPEFRCGV